MKTFLLKIKQWIALKRKNDFFYLEEEIKYRQQHENDIIRARLEGTKAA